MAEYLHGAYGVIQAVGSRVSADSQIGFVYVGTAPVHTVVGGTANVNRPILCANIADAKAALGYSEDFASYSLCEAMKAHFEQNGVGPLIFINVLDPQTHVKKDTVSKNLTPTNGRVLIVGAAEAILDSVVVKSGSDTKVKGTDYSIAYNAEKESITIAELTPGALGTTALTITYSEVDPSAVDAADVIGEDDGMGGYTGLYAINRVYQETGMIPAYLLAPGFSGVPSIHTAMLENASKVNGHWDCYILADIPITHNGSAVTLATAHTWKDSHGYNKENETVYFPMAKGTDGLHYHISVLAAANMQQLLAVHDGIPYKTASNTDAPIIENLYMGEAVTGKVYDDTTINKSLNKYGIASAAFVGGRWAIWGAHSADYSPDNATEINVSETNRMMLYYISNDFQHRRANDVDKPMTSNDLQSIVADEQSRLDALVSAGALIFGEVHFNAEQDSMSDLLRGDFSVIFNVTTTPIAKSLTAIINWTDEGFAAHFQPFAAGD